MDMLNNYRTWIIIGAVVILVIEVTCVGSAGASDDDRLRL